MVYVMRVGAGGKVVESVKLWTVGMVMTLMIFGAIRSSAPGFICEYANIRNGTGLTVMLNRPWDAGDISNISRAVMACSMTISLNSCE